MEAAAARSRSSSDGQYHDTVQPAESLLPSWAPSWMLPTVGGRALDEIGALLAGAVLLLVCEKIVR